MVLSGLLFTLIVLLGALAGLAVMAGGVVLMFNTESRAVGIVLVVVGILLAICPASAWVAVTIFGVSIF